MRREKLGKSHHEVNEARPAQLHHGTPLRKKWWSRPSHQLQNPYDLADMVAYHMLQTTHFYVQVKMNINYQTL